MTPKNHYQLLISKYLNQIKDLTIILVSREGKILTPPIRTDPNRDHKALERESGSLVLPVLDEPPHNLKFPITCFVFLVTQEHTNLPSDEDSLEKYLRAYGKRPLTITLKKVQTP